MTDKKYVFGETVLHSVLSDGEFRDKLRADNVDLSQIFVEPDPELATMTLVQEKELAELRELRDIVIGLFKSGDESYPRLYISLANVPGRPNPQEGPIVTRMREIVLPGSKAI